MYVNPFGLPIDRVQQVPLRVSSKGLSSLPSFYDLFGSLLRRRETMRLVKPQSLNPTFGIRTPTGIVYGLFLGVTGDSLSSFLRQRKGNLKSE